MCIMHDTKPIYNSAVLCIIHALNVKAKRKRKHICNVRIELFMHYVCRINSYDILYMVKKHELLILLFY